MKDKIQVRRELENMGYSGGMAKILAENPNYTNSIMTNSANAIKQRDVKIAMEKCGVYINNDTKCNKSNKYKNIIRDPIDNKKYYAPNGWIFKYYGGIKGYSQLENERGWPENKNCLEAV